jgi:hypothetical protein
MRRRSQFVPDFWWMLQLLTTVPRWLVALAAGGLAAALVASVARLRWWLVRAEP